MNSLSECYSLFSRHCTRVTKGPPKHKNNSFLFGFGSNVQYFTVVCHSINNLSLLYPRIDKKIPIDEIWDVYYHPSTVSSLVLQVITTWVFDFPPFIKKFVHALNNSHRGFCQSCRTLMGHDLPYFQMHNSSVWVDGCWYCRLWSTSLLVFPTVAVLSGRNSAFPDLSTDVFVEASISLQCNYYWWFVSPYSRYQVALVRRGDVMSRMIKVMMFGCLHCWCNVGFTIDDVVFNLKGSRMNWIFVNFLVVMWIVGMRGDIE